LAKISIYSALFYAGSEIGFDSPAIIIFLVLSIIKQFLLVN